MSTTRRDYKAAERTASEWLVENGVPTTQRCVHAVARLYARLALNPANRTDDGAAFVYPSVDWVADHVEYSPRMVKRANAVLGAAGFLGTIGRRARRAVRAIATAVIAAVGKGDTGTRSKVTRAHVPTPAAPIYPFNGEKQQVRPTPTPPPYVPDPPRPAADPALRARLRSGWRDLAHA